MCKNCGGFLKCLILTINTILFVLGVGLAGLSGYAAFNKHSMLHAIIAGANIPGTMIGLYILMGVGIAMALVSFLGCIGAANENRILLWLNFAFMLLLLILQIVAVIFCFVKYKEIEHDVLTAIGTNSRLSESEKMNATMLALLRHALSIIESESKCCGLYGPADYHDVVPPSCYGPRTNETERDSSGENNMLVRDIDDEDEIDEDDFPFPTEGRPLLNRASERPPFPTSPPPITPIVTIQNTPVTPENEPITQHRITAASSTQGALAGNRGPMYTKGCVEFFKPIMYAVGGIGIALLLLELMLLIFIGLLLCDIGKGYEAIA